MGVGQTVVGSSLWRRKVEFLQGVSSRFVMTDVFVCAGPSCCACPRPRRIKGWLCQDCDRSTAECLVLFVLANLRRDWHMTAKNPGAFLMGLLQHR